jgi:hypothetical protein
LKKKHRNDLQRPINKPLLQVLLLLILVGKRLSNDQSGRVNGSASVVVVDVVVIVVGIHRLQMNRQTRKIDLEEVSRVER